MKLLQGQHFVFLITVFGFGLMGCSAYPASLNPQSPAAEQIARLSWVIFVLGGLVWGGVVVLLGGALFRRRDRANEYSAGMADEAGLINRSTNRWVVGGGIVMPTVVLVGLVALTVGTLRSISNIVPSREVVIEVVGRQWWWEVRYPYQNVVTANEIHIPAGQPVEVRLSSMDVIHSFWVPELHGKFDLIPGKVTSFLLQANDPGEYRGQCAEFCGLQHANMGLIVIAHPAETFDAWIEAQVQPATAPTAEEGIAGQQIFLGSECVECHTIRGTPASGTGGPDLTHFASRKTLAAGTLTNTPEHLAAWVSDPQSVKPGSLMPVADLNPSEFLNLLVYLESLK